MLENLIFRHLLTTFMHEFRTIIDDICDSPVKLRGCCCSKAVWTLWTDQLPVSLNAHLSNMNFNYESYQDIFDAADKIYISAKTVTSVAALSNPATAGYSLSEPADSPLNTKFVEQVAAVRQNKNQTNNKNQKPPKNNNNPNQNQQGQQSQQNQQGQNQQKPRKGPRHSSNPPHTCCNLHFRHGSGAWFCQKPLSCPWKDKVSERP